MRRLEGRVALVTGAGAGIGRAIALRFAAEGAHLYIADRDRTAAEGVAGEVAAAGGAASALVADVGRAQEVGALFRAIAEGQKIREVNLDGVVRVARESFALLRVSGHGSLINIASVLAHRGLRQLTAYSTTKGAIVALTRGLAVEYAPHNIRVNALSPGFVETALTARALRNPGIRRALIEATPLRRFGLPEEIAMAALFLASDESAYITGADLAVDGGMAASL